MMNPIEVKVAVTYYNKDGSRKINDMPSSDGGKIMEEFTPTYEELLATPHQFDSDDFNEIQKLRPFKRRNALVIGGMDEIAKMCIFYNKNPNYYLEMKEAGNLGGFSPHHHRNNNLDGVAPVLSEVNMLSHFVTPDTKRMKSVREIGSIPNPPNNETYQRIEEDRCRSSSYFVSRCTSPLNNLHEPSGTSGRTLVDKKNDYPSDSGCTCVLS